MARPKRPIAGEPVRGGKRPAIAPDRGVEDQRGATFSWGFQNLDHGGPWSWFALEGQAQRDVIGKLAEMEKRTWGEAAGSGSAGACKSVDIPSIPTREAHDRLLELDLDEYDHIWEIRLTGRQRIWGIRVQNVFRIVWWDPEHEVWPSSRR